jgi:hypothetical protein
MTTFAQGCAKFFRPGNGRRFGSGESNELNGQAVRSNPASRDATDQPNRPTKLGLSNERLTAGSAASTLEPAAFGSRANAVS